MTTMQIPGDREETDQISTIKVKWRFGKEWGRGMPELRARGASGKMVW